jgi:RHS repeat-associated protein
VVNENSGRAVNYTYDAIYRLLNESITGNANSALNGALAYGLDPVGNRLSLTSTLAGIAAQTNTFDGNDRLVADTYDANGNTLASGGNAFAYDFEDRLTSYNAGAITYVYDGDGNRVSRTAAGSTTRFLVDTLTPTGYAQVAEEVVAGFVVRQYTHGLMRVSQRQNISGTWTTSYFGYDGFGSTRQLLSAAGVVTDTFAFDGFGNLVARTGSTPNQYLYRGEALDAGTGMYYLRARWYRPGLGRFLNRDTYEGENRHEHPCLKCDNNVEPNINHNLYQFAESDPINRSDPSGYSSLVSYSLLARVILGTSVIVTAGFYEAETHAGENLFMGVWNNLLRGSVILTYFAKKADLEKFRSFGKRVGRENGYRPPRPDDFERVHDCLKSIKLGAHDPNVTNEDILEAWRAILCE